MERRDFLVAGAGFALANVTASTTACASNEDARRRDAGASSQTLASTAAADDGHEGHEGHQPSAAQAAVAKAAAGCDAAGRACLQHCLHMLSTGDESMADCAQAVHEMIPVCEATATLARAASEHLTAMASVCRAVCEDCKAACTPHVDAHAECKACHEACTAMLAALDGLA